MRAGRVIVLVAVLSAAFVPAVASAAGGTTYTWVGNTQTASADNHSWSDSRNWDPTGVPGDGDSVVIEQPSNSDCFAHVDGVPTLGLVNFTLSENPALCTTSVSGGAISVSGSFAWNGGKLDTPVTIEGGAVATVNGSNQRLNGLTQDMDMAGTLTMTGVSGQGALQLLHGTVLHVEPAASLISAGPNEIDGSSCCTDPAKVVNDGTLSVAGGTLTIAATELDQRAIVATSLGGRLVTTGAPVTTGTLGSYTGNGGWSMESGSAARFSGTQTLGADFHLELGGLAVNSSSSLAGTATLNGTGTFDWTGGVIEAQLTIGHGVSVEVAGVHTGGGQRVLQGHEFSGGGAGVPVTQTNHGTMTVADGATITTAGQARLVNAADGVIGMAPGTSFSSQSCCVSPDRISNAGTFAVLPTPGSGPALIDFVGYESTGTTAIAGGRTLQLAGGAPNKLTAGRVAGGGRLAVGAPTTVSGTVTIAAHTRLLLGTHGTLAGTATLGGLGGMTWTGGSISGNVTVATSAGVTISGSAVKTIANVGGGSTPSVLRLTVPTTIAAGTSTAHDVVNVGSSVLVLASSTSAGTYTEFDNGQVVNRGTFLLHLGRVFATTFVQSTHGTLAGVLTSTNRGLLQVTGKATLEGTVAVRNSYTPALGSKVTLVRAGTLADSLSCVHTSGTAAGGAHPGHWADGHTATQLTLVWRSGATTC